MDEAIPESAPVSTAPAQEDKPKSAKAIAAAINGKLYAGAPMRPRNLSTDEAVDLAVKSIMEGKNFPPRTSGGTEITHDDRALFRRIARVSAEDFRAMLSERLRVIAQKVMARIEEKLDDGSFRVQDLAYLMTATVDKMNMVEGRQMMNGINVNQQVNIFSEGVTREQIMAQLKGVKLPEPKAAADSEALEVKAEQVG